MSNRRHLELSAACLAVLLLSALPQTVNAGSATATMRVSVTVRAGARLMPGAPPPAVVVTEGDIRRGWVDVTESWPVVVRCNSRNGYMLDFAPMDGPFARASVSGLGSPTEIDARGGWIAQPYSGFETSMNLRFRFQLAPDARSDSDPIWILPGPLAPISMFTSLCSAVPSQRQKHTMRLESVRLTHK
jgi:hypothetical protein